MQSRRSFLRGAGVCLALPMLEMQAEQPKSSQPIKRCVAVSNPFGFFPDAFFPNQAGANYDLPLLLRPLKGIEIVSLYFRIWITVYREDTRLVMRS